MIVSNSDLDIDEIHSCVTNSFKEPGNNQTDNQLYFQDKLLAEVYGVSIHPAVTINGQIYKGDLDGEDIFRAICASFTSRYKPL
jgi:protein-disulfide isomerase